MTQVDTLKRKQFVKGMEQIAQEGAIQIFRELGAGMESVIVGVVGVLQFEVLEYRLKTEYHVEVRQPCPMTHMRWIQNDPDTIDIPGLCSRAARRVPGEGAGGRWRRLRARGRRMGRQMTTTTSFCWGLGTERFCGSAGGPRGGAAPVACLMPCERLSYPPSSYDRGVRAVRVRYPAR